MFVFLLIILIGRHWLNGLEPILAFLGIIAVGLTISLKDVVSNMAGIVIILWRNVFAVGDRIEISTFKGDVVGLGVMYFSILEIGKWVDAEQSTGRVIRVPNSLVIANPVINYTKSFPYIWDEISICITFESNWKKAREILQAIADEKVGDKSGEKSKAVQERLKDNRDEVIHFKYLSPKIYIKPQQNTPVGVVLTLRYLCDPRERRGRENDLWESILEQFHEAEDITITQ
jgi:small-conductance mechanosensitive channel